MQKSLKADSERYYGWSPSRPDQRDYKYAAPLQTLTALPTSYDLTIPRLPAPYEPCLNQGRQGSCGPNATAECLCIVAERNEHSLPRLPSRQFIYYCTRVIMNTVSQDSGVNNRDMMKALANWGWCDDDLDPYSDSMAQIAVKPSAAAYAQGATRKISEYRTVPQTPDQMQGCVASGLPIVFGFTVYESFEGDGPARNGIVPIPARQERVLGGHDMTIVGYNASGGPLPGVVAGNVWPNGTWKARNHWYNGSIPWGDGGYGYFTDGYVLTPQLSGDFWTITRSGLPAPVPPVPPTPPTPVPPVPPVPGVTRVITVVGAQQVAVDGKVV